MTAPSALLALAEPTRLRMVELLAASPRTVGEIAAELDIRQPQATKHLQVLEAADLVTVHHLGRRRVVSLQREGLTALSQWLDRLAVPDPSETVLAQYQRAIDAEAARATGPSGSRRTIRVQRKLAVTPSTVWKAWTSPALVRQWWSPEHFDVVDCEVDPTVGGRLRIVIAERDGARYSSIGEFLTLRPARELRFQLAPLGPDGQPLFSAVHRVQLNSVDDRTALSLTITVSGVTPEAAPIIAGMQPGWRQLLDKLSALLADLPAPSRAPKQTRGTRRVPR